MTYNILILVLSISFLGVSFLPRILKNSMLSIPIIFVSLGFFIFKIPIELSDPKSYNNIILRLTEFCVILSLMGTGLKIDKKLNYKNWRLTLIFLFITMILGISITTILGMSFGFSFPIALLLAASLSPTDPVLASDVQIGPPNEGNEDKVRFTLTTEAGLNDGFAFPFINLAILFYAQSVNADNLIMWFAYDLVYKIFMGGFIGYLCGKLFAFFLLDLPNRLKIKSQGEGFIVVAMTLFSYGLTEIFHGYGFLAVFVAAIFLRDSEKDHELHVVMHEFSDQTERMILVIVLIFFGGFIANGLLDKLSWNDLTFSLLLIFVVRPFTGFIALSFAKMSFFEKFCISFFGIKGIGSIYYISYFLSKNDLEIYQRVWSIIGFIILSSIFIHGITVTSFFEYLDRKKKRLTKVTK